MVIEAETGPATTALEHFSHSLAATTGPDGVRDTAPRALQDSPRRYATISSAAMAGPHHDQNRQPERLPGDNGHEPVVLFLLGDGEASTSRGAHLGEGEYCWMDGGRRRLLVVVAHPDDESFGCGSLLAHASAAGVHTTVCCATRGEAGDDNLGVAEASTLGERRERELRDAAQVLGVDDVLVLDWMDSDMVGEPVPGSLVAASVDEVAEVVTKIIEESRPDVVVTLDGSDGHRDHAHIRDATLAAVERSTWQVERAYLSCLPQSLMGRWARYLSETNPGSNYLELGELGTPDEDITTIVDTSAFYELRWQAIRAHASQTSPFEILPPQLQQAFLATDRLRRIRPPWTQSGVERDFF